MDKYFNKEKFIYRLIIIIAIFISIFLVYKVVVELNDEDTFRAVSRKPYKNVSDKVDALNLALSRVGDVALTNDALNPSNLNLAKVHGVSFGRVVSE